MRPAAPALPRLPRRCAALLLPRGTHPLHAMGTSAGHEHVTPADRYRWDGSERGPRPFVLLQHTLAGTGQLQRGGHTHPITPGQTLLLHFPDEHVYGLPGGGGASWRFFYLCLSGAEVVRLWRAMIERRGPVVTLGDEHPAITQAHALCRDVLRGTIDSPWRASSAAYRLTMTLADALLPPPRPADAAPPLERPAEVQAAIDYLRQHADQAPGVDDLAAAAGYSRFHFSRLFAASEGVPPGEYLIRERLRRAADLLQQTDFTLAHIATETGFHDANHLGKAFKKRYGVTPGTFRTSGMFQPG